MARATTRGAVHRPTRPGRRESAANLAGRSASQWCTRFASRQRTADSHEVGIADDALHLPRRDIEPSEVCRAVDAPGHTTRAVHGVRWIAPVDDDGRARDQTISRERRLGRASVSRVASGLCASGLRIARTCRPSDDHWRRLRTVTSAISRADPLATVHSHARGHAAWPESPSPTCRHRLSAPDRRRRLSPGHRATRPVPSIARHARELQSSPGRDLNQPNLLPDHRPRHVCLQQPRKRPRPRR